MKREYIQPHTEAVVVKCNEKLMWGGLAIESQGEDHTNAKTGFFDRKNIRKNAGAYVGNATTKNLRYLLDQLQMAYLNLVMK